MHHVFLLSDIGLGAVGINTLGTAKCVVIQTPTTQCCDEQHNTALTPIDSMRMKNPAKKKKIDVCL